MRALAANCHNEENLSVAAGGMGRAFIARIALALYDQQGSICPGKGSGANLKGSASGGNGLDDRTALRTELSRGRHFDQEIIVLCVRWYLTFKLSSRDLVQMMAERGIGLAHTTILRWVQRYVPDFEKRWNHQNPTSNGSFIKSQIPIGFRD